MSMLIRPIFSITSAGACTFISLFGVIILTGFAWAFDHNYEAVMGSTEDPKDGHAVAQTLYVAALVYAALVAFCCCQIGVNRRQPRGAIAL